MADTRAKLRSYGSLLTDSMSMAHWWDDRVRLSSAACFPNRASCHLGTAVSDTAAVAEWRQVFCVSRLCGAGAHGSRHGVDSTAGEWHHLRGAGESVSCAGVAATVPPCAAEGRIQKHENEVASGVRGGAAGSCAEGGSRDGGSGTRSRACCGCNSSGGSWHCIYSCCCPAATEAAASGQGRR